jgi:hypothetical protein
MPVAVANSAQVISAATAIDPGNRRLATLSVSNSRSTILARSTI